MLRIITIFIPSMYMLLCLVAIIVKFVHCMMKEFKIFTLFLSSNNGLELRSIYSKLLSGTYVLISCQMYLIKNDMHMHMVWMNKLWFVRVVEVSSLFLVFVQLDMFVFTCYGIGIACI
jgi:hypothetical protein